MGADLGLGIRLKNRETKIPYFIDSAGTGYEFYKLVTDGESEWLGIKLSEETKEKIGNYKIVQDKNSPMLEGEAETPQFLAAYKIKNIAEAIRREIIEKIANNEIQVTAENQIYVHGIMQTIGGICAICYYASDIEMDEAALVCEWY